jgi:hypothetical protein
MFGAYGISVTSASKWKDHDHCSTALDRLLRDLKGSERIGA